MIQKIKNTFWHLPKSIFYNLIYFFPSRSLTLIGVTGTDGKTTTCTLLHHLLTEAGYKTGIISTITSPGAHTTSPDPKDIQKYFKELSSQGYTHVVCEVTSHSLDQHRYWGCHFESSLITNTSREHLDYHKSQESYIKTKAKLFLRSKNIILNRDDDSYPIIKKIISSRKSLSYSIKENSDFQAKNIKITPDKLQFTIKTKNESYPLVTDSPYHYQIYNILASLLVCQSLKLDLNKIIPLLQKFPETKGRREEVQNPFQFRTIVDFAHTPAALEATLSSLKKLTKGRIIVLFGATGGRDQGKRPLMGAVAQKLSDITILTSDDTRNEKIEAINKQIASGFSPKAVKLKAKQLPKENAFSYYDIPNRQDAFDLAIKIAKPNDTVIACGKGHETTILHGNTEYPWSEPEAFRTAFRNRQQKNV